jgi:transposase
VADLFGVCTAALRNFRRRQIETGSPDALPHAGGRAPTFNEDERKQLPALVKAHDDATLAELCQVAEQKFHKRISPSSLCRLRQALELPRKKSRPMPLSAIRPESGERERSIRR